MRIYLFLLTLRDDQVAVRLLLLEADNFRYRYGGIWSRLLLILSEHVIGRHSALQEAIAFLSDALYVLGGAKEIAAICKGHPGIWLLGLLKQFVLLVGLDEWVAVFVELSSEVFGCQLRLVEVRIVLTEGLVVDFLKICLTIQE